MRYWLLVLSVLSACALIACGDDAPSDDPHDDRDSGAEDGSAGAGGNGGSGGNGGNGGSGGNDAGVDAGGEDAGTDAGEDASAEPTCSALPMPTDVLLPPDGELPCDLLPPE